jgi:hypothetical protein
VTGLSVGTPVFGSATLDRTAAKPMLMTVIDRSAVALARCETLPIDADRTPAVGVFAGRRP